MLLLKCYNTPGTSGAGMFRGDRVSADSGERKPTFESHLHLELLTRTNLSQSLSFLISTMGMTTAQAWHMSARLKCSQILITAARARLPTCLPTETERPAPDSAGGPSHQQEACPGLDKAACHSPYLATLFFAPPPPTQAPLPLGSNVKNLRLVPF